MHKARYLGDYYSMVRRDKVPIKPLTPDDMLAAGAL